MHVLDVYTFSALTAWENSVKVGDELGISDSLKAIEEKVAELSVRMREKEQMRRYDQAEEKAGESIIEWFYVRADKLQKHQSKHDACLGFTALVSLLGCEFYTESEVRSPCELTKHSLS